jgi:hypothetical protein
LVRSLELRRQFGRHRHRRKNSEVC